MAQVKAQLNNLRIAPRKVRAVVSLLKGKTVNEALNQIDFMMKRSSLPLKKLIESAVANAENNFQMVRDNLYIKSFFVDEGMKLRRFMPRAMGRATTIHKKTSHIQLVLGEKVAGMRSEKKKEDHKHEAPVSAESVKEEKTEAKKPKIEKEIKTKKPNALANIGRKIFQRKAV